MSPALIRLVSHEFCRGMPASMMITRLEHATGYSLRVCVAPLGLAALTQSYPPLTAVGSVIPPALAGWSNRGVRIPASLSVLPGLAAREWRMKKDRQEGSARLPRQTGTGRRGDGA